MSLYLLSALGRFLCGCEHKACCCSIPRESAREKGHTTSSKHARSTKHAGRRPRRPDTDVPKAKRHKIERRCIILAKSAWQRRPRQEIRHFHRIRTAERNFAELHRELVKRAGDTRTRRPRPRGRGEPRAAHNPPQTGPRCSRPFRPHAAHPAHVCLLLSAASQCLNSIVKNASIRHGFALVRVRIGDRPGGGGSGVNAPRVWGVERA